MAKSLHDPDENDSCQMQAFWMCRSIPNKTHPRPKQRWGFYGQDSRKDEKLYFSIMLTYFSVFLCYFHKHFIDILATTDTTGYFQKIAINIFMKKLFSNDL